MYSTPILQKREEERTGAKALVPPELNTDILPTNKLWPCVHAAPPPSRSLSLLSIYRSSCSILYFLQFYILRFSITSSIHVNYLAGSAKYIRELLNLKCTYNFGFAEKLVTIFILIFIDLKQKQRMLLTFVHCFLVTFPQICKSNVFMFSLKY